MARDLNRLMDDMRNAREVFITEDGNIEDAEEARRNESNEQNGERPPQRRTKLKPEIFGAAEPEIRIATSIFDDFLSEASRSKGETGGILVGPDEHTITQLLPSGPAAKSTPWSWELDAEYLQPQLDKAERRGSRFVGIWHVHPDGYRELSSTDLRATRSILGDPEWGVSQLVLPLSVRQGSNLETAIFVASGTGPNIRHARTILISKHEARLDKGATSPWLATGSFAETPYGQLRLAQDRAALAAQGWKVGKLCALPEGLVLDVARSDVELSLVLPREYPFAPPDVVLRSGDGLREVSHEHLAETARWSSLRSLAEVVEQAARAIRRRPPLLRRRRGGLLHSLSAVRRILQPSRF